MKYTYLRNSVVIITFVSSGSIYAADLPSRMSAQSPAFSSPAYSWSGFYAGLNGGYAKSHSRSRVSPGGSWNADPDWANISAASTHRLTKSGSIWGAQAGYNHQFGSFVLGLESDLNYMGSKASVSVGPLDGEVTGTYATHTSNRINWLATLRPRAGVALERALLYVTGGPALTHSTFSQSVNFLNDSVPGLPVTGANGGANAGSQSRLKLGWAVGAGLEWGFTNNFSVKAEYLYVNNTGNQSFGST